MLTTGSKKCFAILTKYEPQNVFNLEKAELVYCATLDGNFVSIEEDQDTCRRKKSKKRIITIELTMNRASERLRLSVIDKPAKF